MNNLRIPIITSFILVLALIGCDQPYYHVPTDANGDPIITDIGKTTSKGITMLDSKFTVNTYLPNAHEGDTMKVQLLQPQVPENGGEKELLPLEGTVKKITVDSDLKFSVSYTREEANLNKPGDFVRIVFGGETASNQMPIEMERAITTSVPQYKGIEVNPTRLAGTAYFTVKVQPKTGTYNGSTLTVKGKNGVDGRWKEIGKGDYNYSDSVMVPITGADFAISSDTMKYKFIAKRNGLTETLVKKIIIGDPVFFFEHSATLSLSNANQSGINLLTGDYVQASNNKAVLTINTNNDGALVLKGGAAWTSAGNSISFVASDQAMYSNNNPKDAKQAYNAGSAKSEVALGSGSKVFIFKINSSQSSVPYYGVLNISNISIGESVMFSYRIGNLYEQLPTLDL